MTIKSSLKQAIIGTCLIFLAKGNLLAQEGPEVISKNGQWTFLAEPYLMFPNMKGTVGLGILPDGTVDASANDIFYTGFEHFPACI